MGVWCLRYRKWWLGIGGLGIDSGGWVLVASV